MYDGLDGEYGHNLRIQPRPDGSVPAALRPARWCRSARMGKSFFITHILILLLSDNRLHDDSTPERPVLIVTSVNERLSQLSEDGPCGRRLRSIFEQLGEPF
jgi:hypothetical protein